MKIYKKWFDENGWILRPLPKRACMNAIHPGPCDSDILILRIAIGFNTPRLLAIPFLREYGAWSQSELEAMSAEHLADTVLWIAAGNISEGESFDGLIH